MTSRNFSNSTQVRAHRCFLEVLAAVSSMPPGVRALLSVLPLSLGRLWRAGAAGAPWESS